MIRITGLRYTIGAFMLAIDFQVAKGRYMVLLGPSGSGKTLLLENICGLLACSEGSVHIGAADVTCLPARLRGIGYVPQDGALFDHLSVQDNIGYSLRIRRWPAARLRQRVEEVAALLGVSHLLSRRIKGLSGGEKQRVALGRAIAFAPSVLLLDEPVSALDEPTRDDICGVLKRLQQELGLTVIHVCHSLEETRQVADQVGILSKGTVVQTGTIAELSERPASLEVARILRLANIFAGEGDGSGRITTNGETIFAQACSGPVSYFIKPWSIRPGSAHTESGPQVNTIRGTIACLDHCGPAVRLTLAKPFPLVFYLSHREAREMNMASGAAVSLTFGKEDVVVLDR
jgi:molybdate transport system ATP-binding protein/molybdate/tungstate transport system ATP-binding protein